ncbi:MAG: hypothetical protein ABFD12_00235 [Syntrophorhabdus sp.]
MQFERGFFSRSKDRGNDDVWRGFTLKAEMTVYSVDSLKAEMTVYSVDSLKAGMTEYGVPIVLFVIPDLIRDPRFCCDFHILRTMDSRSTHRGNDEENNPAWNSIEELIVTQPRRRE